MADITRFTRRLVIRGGKGSGHRGHKGIPGQRGGSLPTYPEGMAPSDQPAPSSRRWRTLTDDEISDEPKPLTNPAIKTHAMSTNLRNEVDGKTGHEWLSAFGRRIGAEAMGPSLNDSQMQRIKEFYWWLQEKHAMTAFEFTRKAAKALMEAGLNQQGVRGDFEAQKLQAVAQYLTQLTDKQAWTDGEPATGDEEAQFYVLHELASSFQYAGIGDLFNKDGTLNTKSRLASYVRANMGAHGYDEAFDRWAEEQAAGRVEHINATRKYPEDRENAYERITERKLMERADAIDRAFGYADTQGEQVRQGLLALLSDERYDIPGLKAKVAEEQAKNDAARRAYIDKNEALNAALESSAEYKAARAELDREYDTSVMTPADMEAAMETKRKAYLVISKLDRELDDAKHKTDEWFLYAAAGDYLNEASKELENAKKARAEAAREFIEEHGFGSTSTLIEGRVVSMGRRPMSKGDVDFALKRNEQCRRWLAKMVSRDVIRLGTPLNYYNQRVNRGSAWENGYTMYSGADVTHHLHESGHWLERYNDDVHAQAVAFLRYRNQGEDYVRMSAARKRTLKRRAAEGLSTDHLYTRGFTASEVAAADKWRDPYAGKRYGRDYRATEVLSMGLQWLYDDPYAFAVEDPEHFNYTLAMIAGAK